MSQVNILQESGVQYKAILTQLAIVANFVPCCFNRGQIHNRQDSIHSKDTSPHNDKGKEGRMLRQTQDRSIHSIVCVDDGIQSELAGSRVTSSAANVEGNIRRIDAANRTR